MRGMTEEILPLSQPSSGEADLQRLNAALDVIIDFLLQKEGELGQGRAHSTSAAHRCKKRGPVLTISKPDPSIRVRLK